MKNKYEIRGDIATIFLKQKDGNVIETIVDALDLLKMEEFKNTWYAHYNPSVKNYYVLGTLSGGSKVYAHRFLTEAPTGMDVDHINHSTLDNRRSVNLRVITRQQNNQNLKKSQSNNGTSNQISVTKGLNDTWVVRFDVFSSKRFQRYFHSLEEAENIAKHARAVYLPFSEEARIFDIEKSKEILKINDERGQINNKSSGIKNITRLKDSKMWIVRIQKDKKPFVIGRYLDINEAIKERDKFLSNIGF